MGLQKPMLCCSMQLLPLGEWLSVAGVAGMAAAEEMMHVVEEVTAVVWKVAEEEIAHVVGVIPGWSRSPLTHSLHAG